MRSFGFRGKTVDVNNQSIVFQPEKKNPPGGVSEQMYMIYFHSRIVHAHAMDQNIVVVLLENGELWQCGGVKEAKLVPQVAAAASQDGSSANGS